MIASTSITTTALSVFALFNGVYSAFIPHDFTTVTTHVDIIDPGSKKDISSHLRFRRDDPTSQLLHIMPSASTCSGAPIASECALASDAVQPMINSFTQYGINTAAEQAALISWMAYESAELKYVKNHFPAPGRPGQGTRNMMMPDFVAEYASSIPEVTSQFKVEGAAPADILDAVLACGHDFGSAAWFYSTKCSDQIKAGVQTGSQAGWEAFLTQCVQTTIDEGTGDNTRAAYWTRACEALSVPKLQ